MTRKPEETGFETTSERRREPDSEGGIVSGTGSIRQSLDVRRAEIRDSTVGRVRVDPDVAAPDEEEHSGSATQPRELSTTDEGAGSTFYAEYIREQLAAQEDRKRSLEQRGVTVITTSGALVTLLFGLTALSVRRAATFEIPNGSAVFLVWGLGLFVAAAVFALLTNIPRSYQSVTVDALRDAVADRWGDDKQTASRMVALTRLKEIAAAKQVNRQKGRLLTASMICEILAVAQVAIAMGIVLWRY